MSVNESLYNCEDPAVWRAVHGKYWSVVEAKSAVKGKTSGKLLQLDRWFQEELPAAISARSERSLTHAELVNIMAWKLTKGKFRPRLQQLIGSNNEEAVQSSTSKAFGLLPDVQAAIAELCKLKGVGPATASAVLAAGAPGEVAFMSDEAVESIAELRPVEYTAKHYALFLQKILNKSSQLNKAAGQRDWTPHRVEQCLWAWAVANQIQPSLLQEFSLMDATHTSLANQKPEKRKTADEEPSKRQKTERS
ncbi:uncharacterized protein LOC107747858 [Sinocyclocheilus rhinocerous]|uniref:Uncharacterized LOC107747858 n=1 Tax=Sinocyclocheilus rhinocerous TaxID=307959 RepID=A0A673HX10_9TELE|nr:PREDICTED: uncharacterized protein LOC107747858 [Sinocyclocheilus rhinocerous]XP_016417957.1 PREDICTED: uncharacterized protein LOC107747858 [Sinocyclocheilus rhinocerous]